MYPSIPCIYKIYFEGTDWFYIGSTNNLKRRIQEHFSSLKKGSHDNPIFLNVYNKYTDFLKVEILEEVLDVENLISREQFYIDSLEPNINVNKVAGCIVQRPKNTNVYTLLSPDGTVWYVKSLLKLIEIAKIEGDPRITRISLNKVTTGERVYCKGWKCLLKDGQPIKRKDGKNLSNLENYKDTEEYKKLNSERGKINVKYITNEDRKRGSLKKLKKYLITKPCGTQICIKNSILWCQANNFSMSSFYKAVSMNRTPNGYKIEIIKEIKK